MLEYSIAISTDPTTLETIINRRLKEGWTLQGGIAVYGYSFNEVRRDLDVEYAQAMTREVSES